MPQVIIRRLWRVLAVVGLSVVFLTAGPATAGDCYRPPAPGNPNSGVAAYVDPIPLPDVVFINLEEYTLEELAGPNPFDEDTEESLYSTYGWGSYEVHNYDPEQFAPTCVSGPAATNGFYWIANLGIQGMALLGAVSVFLTRLVFAPDTFAVLSPIFNFLTGELGLKVGLPLTIVTVAITLLWVMFKARSGNIVKAASLTGWPIAVLAASTIIVMYGAYISPMIESTALKAVSTVGSITGDGEDAPDHLHEAVGNIMTREILYPMYCNATLGRSNDDAIEAHCEDLFRAANYSTMEQTALDGEPSYADELRERKADRFNEVAAEVREDYPADAGYNYLAGNETTNLIVQVSLIGGLTMWLAVLVLIVGLVRLLLTLVEVKFLLHLFPMLAVIGQHPKYREAVTGIANFAVRALVSAVLLAIVTLAWIAGGLGGLISADIPAPIVLLLLFAMTWAFFKLRKHMSVPLPAAIADRLPGMPSMPKFRRRHGAGEGQTVPGQDTTDTEPQPTPVPQPTPAEVNQKPRRLGVVGAAAVGAAKGAATTAAVTVATGGTGTAAAAGRAGAKVTAGAAKAAAVKGAKRGAATAATTYVMNHRTAASKEVPYYPATPATPAERGPAKALPPTRSHTPRALPPGTPQRTVHHDELPGQEGPSPVRRDPASGPIVIEGKRVYSPGDKAGPTETATRSRDGVQLVSNVKGRDQ